MSLCCTRVAGPWRIGSCATPSDGEPAAWIAALARIPDGDG